MLSSCDVLGAGRSAADVAMLVLAALAIVALAARLISERRRADRVSAEARRARVDLERILQGIPDGVTLQDPRGKLLFANEVAARIIGFPDAAALLSARSEDILQRFELFDVDGAPLPLDRLPNRALLAGEKPAEQLVQYAAKTAPGRRWSLVNASGVHDDEGRLSYVVNLFRDVTERQRQQQALAVSREWFSTALRSIGDAVIATDARGHVTFLNPVAEQLTGFAQLDAEGRPLSEVFRILSEPRRERLPSPVERVIETGAVVGLSSHTLLVRRGGSELSIDHSAAPIRAEDGALVGVVLVFRDVTAERRAADRRDFLALATLELNSSLDYNTTLATVARLAVPRMADWCAVDVVENGELRRLAVAHVDPTKIARVEELQRRYPPDPNAARGAGHIVRTGKAEMIPEIPAALVEAAARDEDHRRLLSELALHSYIGVPMSAGGATFGVITLVTAESKHVYTAEDLELGVALADRAALAVEHARLFRAAERAKTEAEQANRAKDDFLAMLGHELRNPLAPIVTAVEMMKQRPDVAASRERLTIERQVKHVVRLVDDLLDVSRIVHGRVVLARERVDLREVVERSLELAGPLLDERRHRVDVTVPEGLNVLADGVRLVQVFTNLLTNAAKYTGPGGHIGVAVARDGEHVVASISDDGMGIAPDMLPRIFDLFVQAPQTIDRSRGGLGLGLTIAQSLVRSFGGTVNAHSPGPGQGSRFVVSLPALDTLPPELAPAEPARGESAPPRRRHRILLVDDNADALEMLAEALRLLGHEIVTAGDGAAALALAPRVKPLVALLDIGLPGMDGYELGQRLRSLPGLEGLQLVALTGYGQASDRERSRAAGFSAHLVKPVEIVQIETLLASFDN